MSKGKKIALVLSSGGARGLAHIGVIERLEEEGFEIS
ncbi:MAG: patatin, partial [Bacteroidota bacterium]